MDVLVPLYVVLGCVDVGWCRSCSRASELLTRDQASCLSSVCQVSANKSSHSVDGVRPRIMR